MWGRTSFPYVEAALKEALRVFPTAPTLVRETSRGVSLGGYSLAKGQIVAVSVYSMHHNSVYWVARPTTLVKACQTRGYCLALSLRMYLLARSNSHNAGNIEEREDLQHKCCFFPHVYCLCHQPGVHSRIRRPTCQSGFCAGRPRQQRGPKTAGYPLAAGREAAQAASSHWRRPLLPSSACTSGSALRWSQARSGCPQTWLNKKHVQLHGVCASHPLTGASGAARDHHAVASTWRAHAGLPLALGRVMPQVGCPIMDVLAAGLSGWGSTA